MVILRVILFNPWNNCQNLVKYLSSGYFNYPLKVCFKIHAPDSSLSDVGICGREEDFPKQGSKQATKALKKKKAGMILFPDKL